MRDASVEISDGVGDPSQLRAGGGRTYPFVVDRAEQAWWPRPDGDGFHGRWGPAVASDPFGGRAGMGVDDARQPCARGARHVHAVEGAAGENHPGRVWGAIR